MTELASDLVYEILSRVPSLQILDSCKTVSKGWEQLIDDPDFMTSYCQRTEGVSGYFIQGSKYSQTESQFVSLHDIDDSGSSSSSKNLMMSLPKNTNILASCRQGLLYCSRMDERNHYKYIHSVCKPTTGQSQDLPSHSSPRWETVSVAIMVLRSSPLRYKIVRLSETPTARAPQEEECYRSYECKIFDSDAWEWRDAGAIKFPTPELITKPSPPVVTAANSVCWLTTQDNVVEFCEPTQSFHKFPLPPETTVFNNNINGYKRLVEYQGRLGLVCEAGNDDGRRCFELWLREPQMNSIITNNWRKKVEFTRVEDNADPVGFYNPGIAFFRLCDELTFYRVEDSSSLRKVEINWLQKAGSFSVFPFRSDSEPVHLGRSC